MKIKWREFFKDAAIFILLTITIPLWLPLVFVGWIIGELCTEFFNNYVERKK